MTPQVSIVVTCFNYGDFIDECLRSVQGQTFLNYEVIIVDDGSTDKSADVIRLFLEDVRFNYIKQKNGGQANAKNRGIRESKSALIAFLDADDVWLPDKLERQIPLFEDRAVGVVFSQMSLIDNQSRQIDSSPVGKYLLPQEGNVTTYLFFDNFVPFSSSVVRRECFAEFGKFDENLAMGIDWDRWLRFSTKYQFKYCQEKLLQYRVGHSGQMSKKLSERIRCADKIIAAFLAEFPHLLSGEVIKEASYYTYCLRGYVLRQYGLKYSLRYYLKAISLCPLRYKAYLGLIKAPLRALFGR